MLVRNYMNIEHDVPILYTVETVAKILSISRSVVYNLIRDGRLDSVKIGASRRVTDVQLSDFISGLS